MKNIIKNLLLALFVVTTLTTLITMPSKAEAVVDATKYQEAKVSITIDDGFKSTYQYVLPILQARNLKATVYVTTGFINSGVTDDDNLPAMTWANVQELQNTYGWEIGNHTQTHPELPTITQAQIASQFSSSQADFATHGITPTNFASPFGAYDNKTLTEALKLFYTHRGFADIGYEAYPADRDVIKVQQVNSATTVAQVKGYIDAAKANKQWLVLVFHDVAPAKNPNYEYTTTTSELTQIADYLVSSGVKVQTVKDAVTTQGQSVAANYNFADGLTNWTTSNTQTTLDTNNNGAFSNSQNSVKMTGGATATHLFSNAMSNTSGATYLLEAFYNTLGLTSGEFGFYVDEYDDAGNWISGQWLNFVANNTIGYFRSFYQATSDAVKKFATQVYLTANAAGVAYVDNVDVHNLDATGTPTPTPTATPTPSGSPTPTPTSGATNLVSNSGFEDANGTPAKDWTTDNAAWTLSTTNEGNEGVNSAKATNTGTANHLFSKLIAIPSTVATYTWDSYIKTTNLTGEFGFYVDEYDSAGNWISGQWKGMISAAFTGVKTIVYVPTSNLVNQIRLQYYNSANNTGSVNVDSVSLTSNITPTTTPTPTGTVTPTPTVDPSGTPTPTPTVTPTVTPTPTGTPATNLVVNPSFETTSGAFAANWTQDTGNWTIDSLSAGNDGANSATLVMNGVKNHLFTALIAIDSTATYTWKTYIKTANLAGEFGFYIDEYDAAGTWISGQWKTMISAPYTNTLSISYTPTSATVKQVRLQYYNTAASTGNILLDNISFTKN